MRIAFIVTLFPRLSETFILEQITGLIDRGHEVDIFAVTSANEPIVNQDVIKYKLLDRTFYDVELPKSKLIRYLKAVVSHYKKFP